MEEGDEGELTKRELRKIKKDIQALRREIREGLDKTVRKLYDALLELDKFLAKLE